MLQLGHGESFSRLFSLGECVHASDLVVASRILVVGDVEGYGLACTPLHREEQGHMVGKLWISIYTGYFDFHCATRRKLLSTLVDRRKFMYLGWKTGAGIRRAVESRECSTKFSTTRLVSRYGRHDGTVGEVH